MVSNHKNRVDQITQRVLAEARGDVMVSSTGAAQAGSAPTGETPLRWVNENGDIESAFVWGKHDFFRTDVIFL